MGVAELMRTGRVPRRPLVNLPGCPPIPEVISAVLAYRVAFGRFPELDAEGRPVSFYGETVHDRCSRRGHYEAGRFAKTFDDAGARAGWCLLNLGCKGPVTRNACSTVRWNGVSNPMESGHPCLGCSEPGFWDKGSFYRPLTLPAGSSVPAPQTPTQRGAAVYDSHCAACHANPASLGTPPEEMGTLLRSDTVRSHRFTLDEPDMQTLLEYLKRVGI
jgi:hydrogenase small subunit